MDAIALLLGDHNRMRGLFARFKSAHDAEELEEAAGLVVIISTELQVHMHIEEQTFYPGVRDADPELTETLAEGIEEHHEVKLLLGEIADLEPSDPAWAAKVTVIIENNEHHFEEEEEELFPSVRGATDVKWLKAMAEKLEANKRELGAPTLADKIDLTNEQLHELATAQAIPGRSSMSHDELAAAVGINQ